MSLKRRYTVELEDGSTQVFEAECMKVLDDGSVVFMEWDDDDSLFVATGGVISHENNRINTVRSVDI